MDCPLNAVVTNRVPVNLTNFTRDFLTPMTLYLTTAVLCTIPRTFSIRLGLLPIILWTAFRASITLDFASGWSVERDRMVYLNQGLVMIMTTVALRAIILTCHQKPPKRIGAQSTSKAPTLVQTLLDGIDLAFNLRGIGWEWSKGLQLPTERRPLDNVPMFTLLTFRNFLGHIFAFDLLIYICQTLAPGYGSPTGGTIFDWSFPLPLALFRTWALTYMTGMAVYTAINSAYLFATIIGVLVLRQSPSAWPPLFGRPYTSTSLTQFWALDWHQMFRDNFVNAGGKPFAFATGTGRVGLVVGSFMVSGLMHDVGLWAMDRGHDTPLVVGYFLLQGLGGLCETLWKRHISGKKVGGFWGWVWTQGNISVWGVMLIEAWGTRGLVGSQFLPQHTRPTTLANQALNALVKRYISATA